MIPTTVPHGSSSLSSSSSFKYQHHHQKYLFLVILILSSIFIYVLFTVQYNKSSIVPVYLSSEEEELFLKEYFARLESSSLGTQCNIEENKGTLTREMIGPHVWNVFHAFVQNYKDLDQDKLLNWIYVTADLFPCKQCSNDFKGRVFMM